MDMLLFFNHPNRILVAVPSPPPPEINIFRQVIDGNAQFQPALNLILYLVSNYKKRLLTLVNLSCQKKSPNHDLMTLSSPLRTFTSLPPPPLLCCSEFQVWPHRGATGHVPAQLNTGAAGRGGGGGGVIYHTTTTTIRPQQKHNSTPHTTHTTALFVHCSTILSPKFGCSSLLFSHLGGEEDFCSSPPPLFLPLKTSPDG